MNPSDSTATWIEPDIVPWIGICVRERREAVGLSQVALARKCDVSRSGLGQLERGRKNGGTVGNLQRVCRGLGICVDELISEAGRRARQNDAMSLKKSSA